MIKKCLICLLLLLFTFTAFSCDGVNSDGSYGVQQSADAENGTSNEDGGETDGETDNEDVGETDGETDNEDGGEQEEEHHSANGRTPVTPIEDGGTFQ